MLVKNNSVSKSWNTAQWADNRLQGTFWKQSPGKLWWEWPSDHSLRSNCFRWRMHSAKLFTRLIAHSTRPHSWNKKHLLGIAIGPLSLWQRSNRRPWEGRATCLVQSIFALPSFVSMGMGMLQIIVNHHWQFTNIHTPVLLQEGEHLGLVNYLF